LDLSLLYDRLDLYNRLDLSLLYDRLDLYDLLILLDP
jgi:hypothetical protein